MLTRAAVSGTVDGTIQALQGNASTPGELIKDIAINSFMNTGLEVLGDFAMNTSGNMFRKGKSLAGQYSLEFRAPLRGASGRLGALDNTGSLLGGVQMPVSIVRNSNELVDDALKLDLLIRARKQQIINGDGQKVMVRVCFTAGTQVMTSEGLVNIEDIKIGTKVYARDEMTGEGSGLKPVVELYETPDQEVIEITLENNKGESEIFRSTLTHPFYIDNVGWCQAGDLKPGYCVSSLDQGILEVKKVNSVAGLHKVYNFEVSGYHTYFVGKLGAWVHNENCDGTIITVDEMAMLRRGIVPDTINPGTALMDSDGLIIKFDADGAPTTWKVPNYNGSKSKFDEFNEMFTNLQSTMDGKQVRIKTSSGTKHSLNPELMNPRANIHYEVKSTHGDVVARFNYKTNANGKVAEAWATIDQVSPIHYKSRDKDYRSTSTQKYVAGLGGDGYVGGHIFRTQYLGPPELINNFPQLNTVNRSGGAWYAIENQWAKMAKLNGGSVSPRSVFDYGDNIDVPTGYQAIWVDANGNLQHEYLDN